MSHALRIAPLLALVYALTLASADPVDLLTGAVLGVVIVVVLGRRLRLRPERADPRAASRILWFPVFAAAVLADVLAGVWDVALRVVGVRPLDCPGIVRVPVGGRSDRGVAVSALATTLSPGSVLVDIDAEREEMLIHVIDASDPERVREHCRRRYERLQRRVFP